MRCRCGNSLPTQIEQDCQQCDDCYAVILWTTAPDNSHAILEVVMFDD